MKFYERAKSIIQIDALMKLYNAKEPLYLETAGLLQARDGIWFPKD